MPKPAPPKTKKSDLVEPTTFTVADKIVDQVGVVLFRFISYNSQNIKSIASKRLSSTQFY